MKILTLDIETSPALLYSWGLWDQTHGLNQIVQQGEVICFAAKWHGKKKVHFYSTHHDGKQTLVEAAHRLLSEADVAVGYNSRSFDIKHLQAEMAQLGMGPPEPFAQIDLMAVSKSSFRLLSNKLENVSDRMGLEGKLQHSGFQLWRDCMAGDEAAWKQMKRYNIQDVRVTEQLYDRLRPWIKNHPNHNLYGGVGCPSCGGHNLMRRGYHRTQTQTYIKFRCEDCGSYSRSTKRDHGTTIRSA